MDGRAITLQTRGLTVQTYEPDWRNRLLAVIADPNIAYILMLLGIYGLFFELCNPGATSCRASSAASACCWRSTPSRRCRSTTPASALIAARCLVMVAGGHCAGLRRAGLGGLAAWSIGSISSSTARALVRRRLGVMIAALAVIADSSSRGFISLVVRSRRGVVIGAHELIGSRGEVTEDPRQAAAASVCHSEVWDARSAVRSSAAGRVMVTGREARVRSGTQPRECHALTCPFHPVDAGAVRLRRFGLARHARVRARRRVSSRTVLGAHGPGPRNPDSGRRPDGEGESARRRDGRAAAGRHHPGQRVGEGERGGLLPRDGSEAGHQRSRGLSTPPPSSPRQRCVRWWASSSWTSCWRSAK